ncbi:MAG: rod shape-determining protein MreD [Patescibacteria group bacterium]
MKSILIIASLLLAVMLQTTLAGFLTFQGAGPNLILVLVLILIIARDFKKFWWVVVLGGFFLDLLTGLPFGLVSLSLIATAYLVDWFKSNVFSSVKFWIAAVLITLGSLVYQLLLFILARAFRTTGLFDFKYLLIEIVYNLLVAFIFYAGLKKVFGKI